MIRVFAVGHRLRLSSGVSAEAFHAALDAEVRALPLAPDRANLVVLPEYIGLVTLFGGRAGALARRARTITQAFLALTPALLPRLLAVRARFGALPAPRMLLLAATDRLRRPFERACARVARERGVWLAAGTLGAEAEEGPNGELAPTSPEVWNRAHLYRPDGTLAGVARKVFLTPQEGEGGLCLSSGRLEDLAPVDVEGTRVGLAVCFDAFQPEVIRHLAERGARLVCQLSANSGAWAGETAESRRWQSEEWLDAVAAPLDPPRGDIRWVASAMMTGNLFDLAFDGQSAILARGPAPENERLEYVGCEGTGVYGNAHFVALSPWAFPDPGGPLVERRAALRALGRRLAPRSGDPRENGYAAGVAWADLA